MSNDEDFFVNLSAKLIQDIIEKIPKKIFAVGEEGYKSIQIESKAAFKKYYKTSINKYIGMKTILYKGAPVNLYKFYVNVELQDDKARLIKTDNINKLLKITNNILITGTAGCGKSTLIKHLFLNSIKNQRGIPIFIELKNINNNDEPLIDFIYDTLSNFNFNLDKEHFLKLLSSGKFILFFDGFDEIKSNKSEKVTIELMKMRDKYYNNKFIVTSRPDERHVSWNNFTELQVQPLTKKKALELIRKIDYNQDTKKIFLNKLDHELYDLHTPFASNPLLLTIMLMTFTEYSDIPQKTHLFYSQAFETLFSKHDATKAGFKREHYTKLPIDDFKKILSSFCLQSYLEHEIDFSSEKIMKYLSNSKKLTGIEFKEEDFLNDLLKNLCVLVQDGIKYTFTHRTFQEYFSATYIVNTKANSRKKLIKIAAERIGFDIVFQFVFEINRNILEEDYIIKFLEKLKKETKYGKLKDTDIAYLYYKKAFDDFGIIINKTQKMGNILEYMRIKDMICHNMIIFISRSYASICPFRQKKYDKKKIMENNKALYKELERNHTHIPTWGRRGLRINVKYLEKNKRLRSLFSKIIVTNQTYERYKYSMEIIGKMIQENKKREESIDKILFVSKTPKNV